MGSTVIMPDKTTCKKCGGDMADGVALQNTLVGVPEFAGSEVVTVSYGGAGKLIECAKCVRCGWSVTKGDKYGL